MLAETAGELVRAGRVEPPGATETHTAGDAGSCTSHLSAQSMHRELVAEEAWFTEAVQSFCHTVFVDPANPTSDNIYEAVYPGKANESSAMAIAKAITFRCCNVHAPLSLRKTDVDLLVMALLALFFATEDNPSAQEFWALCSIHAITAFKGNLHNVHVSHWQVLNLIKRLQFGERTAFFGGKVLERQFELAVRIAVLSKWYFPNEAFIELLDALDPTSDGSIAPHSEGYMWRIGMLSLLLPPNAAGEQQALRREKLLSLFADPIALSHSTALLAESYKLLGRLAKHDIDAHLQLHSVLPTVIQSVIWCLGVLQSSASSSGSKDEWAPITMLAVARYDSHSITESAAKVVAYSLCNEERHLSMLEQALSLVANFVHPSAEGSYTPEIVRFARSFIGHLTNRIEAERLDGAVHGGVTLSHATVHRICSTLSQLVKHGHHVRNGQTRSEVSMLAGILGEISPSTIAPVVCTQFERALTEGNSSQQQLRSAIKLLDCIVRPLVLAERSGLSLHLGVEGDPSPTQFLTAAMQHLVSNGVDASDPEKTAATCRFFCSVLSNEIEPAGDSSGVLSLDIDMWAEELISSTFAVLDSVDDSALDAASSSKIGSVLGEHSSYFHPAFATLLNLVSNSGLEDICQRVSSYFLGVSGGAIHSEAEFYLSPLLQSAPKKMHECFVKKLFLQFNTDKLSVDESHINSALQKHHVWLLRLLEIVGESRSAIESHEQIVQILRNRREQLSKHPMKRIEGAMQSCVSNCVHGITKQSISDQWKKAKWACAFQNDEQTNAHWTCALNDATGLQAFESFVQLAHESLNVLYEGCKNVVVYRVHLMMVTGFLNGISHLLPVSSIGMKYEGLKAMLQDFTSGAVKALNSIDGIAIDDSTISDLVASMSTMLCNPASSQKLSAMHSRWYRRASAMLQRRVCVDTFSLSNADKRSLVTPRWLLVERAMLLEWHVQSKQQRFPKNDSKLSWPEVPKTNDFKIAFETLQQQAIVPYPDVRRGTISQIVQVLREYPELTEDIALTFSDKLSQQSTSGDEHVIKGACSLLSRLDHGRYAYKMPKTMEHCLQCLLLSEHHDTAQKQAALSREYMPSLLSTLTLRVGVELPTLEETLNQRSSNGKNTHWRYGLLADCLSFILRVNGSWSKQTRLVDKIACYARLVHDGSAMQRKLGLKSLRFFARMASKQSIELDVEPISGNLEPGKLMDTLCADRGVSQRDRGNDEGETLIEKTCIFMAKPRSNIKSKYAISASTSSLDLGHVRSVRFSVACCKDSNWIQSLLSSIEVRLDSYDAHSIVGALEALAGVLTSNHPLLCREDGLLARMKRITMLAIDNQRGDLDDEVLEAASLVAQYAESNNPSDIACAEVASNITFDESEDTGSLISRRLHACAGFICGSSWNSQRAEELAFVRVLVPKLQIKGLYTVSNKTVRSKAAKCTVLLVGSNSAKADEIAAMKQILSDIGFSCMEDVYRLGTPERIPEEDETHCQALYAVRAAETSTEILREILLRHDGPKVYEQIVHLLPQMLKLLNSPNSELSSAVRNLAGMAREEVFPADEIPRVAAALEAAAESTLWMCRGSACVTAAVIACNHAYLITQHQFERLANIVVRGVYDDRAEVRNAACDSLAPLLRGPGEIIVLPTILQQGIDGVQSGLRAEQTLHAHVLLLSACVYSQPFLVPSWMPSALAALGSVGHSHDPSSVRDAVRKALKAWQRSHSESMQEAKTMFTQEQWEVVEGALCMAPTYIV